MYFPYLRGKEFEIQTIAELATLLKNSGRVIPILEPVRRSNADIRRLSQATQLGVPLVLVENPEKGELAGAHDYARSLVERLNAPGVRPGYLVGPRTSAKDIEGFLKRNSGRSVAFIHMGSANQPEKLSALQQKAGNVEFQIFLGGKSSGDYRAAFANGNAVILEDGFEKQARNQDYPPKDFFSDRFKTYKRDGFYGFGDFLIVGNAFTKGGGALAVTIHLTNREDGGIVVRHFISDRTTLRNVDTAGKFFEALTKAVAFMRTRQFWRATGASREFQAMVNSNFQGLGHVKKVSMKHHIEVLDAALTTG